MKSLHQIATAVVAIAVLCAGTSAQSGRVGGYSDSAPGTVKKEASAAAATAEAVISDDDVIRVETDLITVPVSVSDRGRPVPGIQQREFRIFENGIEQELAYFSADDQPFTVALMLDMSYSSVFKLAEIQSAAKLFVNHLRPNDRMMVVSFAERAEVLCRPTSDRRILSLAIGGAKIASGTSMYDAFDVVAKEHFRGIAGRKAIVVLSDGVDTTSRTAKADDILREFADGETLIYPIQYDTFDDVRENRRKNAEVRYDDDDRPYLVEAPLVKGQREDDYETATEFLRSLAAVSGGRVFRVTSSTNLQRSFAAIADELRKIYSLGYYPTSDRRPGVEYQINIRVYRPNLTVKARGSYAAGRR